MRRDLIHAMVAAGLVCGVAAYGQGSKAKNTASQSKETFWHWALRFAGVSANPNTLKGADDLVSGQVWIADLTSGTRRKLVAGDDYRSPVFYPGGSGVLALQGDDVVRISPAGKQREKLYTITGIAKLIGFSMDEPSEVLMLKQDERGNVTPAQLSVTTGNVTVLLYDPQSTRDRQMLEHLEDWQRSYGDTVLYVKQESIQALSGAIEISNVFIKTAGRDPENVSHCETTNCGQPSLSPDGNHVVFINAGS